MTDQKLFPIVIFCFNRPEHLKQTIESLKKNPESKDSQLFIFSDAAKTEADTLNVEIVRTYINSIIGFKEVIPHFNNENKGLSSNIIFGLNRLFEFNQALIVLEDDLLISPDFLSFMNRALHKFERKSHIYSISGYLYPIDIPQDFKSESLLLRRPSSLGWATWKDRWNNFFEVIEDFDKLEKNRNFIKGFNLLGDDVIAMLKKQQLGVISSWAIRWAYTHYYYKAYCLFPIKSKVFHNGSDGSGTNINFVTDRFDVDWGEMKIELEENPVYDKRFDKSLSKYYSQSIIRKFINWFKYGIAPFY